MIQVWFTQNRRGIIILYFFSSYLESPADHKMICVFWIRWRTKPLLFDNCLETRSIYFEKNFKMQQILHTQVSSWSFSIFPPKKKTNKLILDRLIHPEKFTWNTDMEVCFDISPPAPRSFEHTVAVACVVLLPGDGSTTHCQMPNRRRRKILETKQPGRRWPKTMIKIWEGWKLMEANPFKDPYLFNKPVPKEPVPP